MAGLGSVASKGYNADGSVRYAEVSALPAHAETGSNPYTFPSTHRTMPQIAVYNNVDDGAMFVAGDYQHKVYPAKVSKAGVVQFSDNPEYIGDDTMWPQVIDIAWTATGQGSQSVAVMDNGDAVILSGDSHDGTSNNGRAKYVVFDRSLGTKGNFDPLNAHSTGLYAQTLGNAAGKDMYSIKRWRTDVAMNGTGQGVMVWMVRTGDVATGETDVVARRFTIADVAGVATLAFNDATEWVVNQVTIGDQYAPCVAIDDDGRFVTVWADDDRNLYGRAFEADGTGLNQFQINPTLLNELETYWAPDVAVDKDAGGNMDFVIDFIYNADVTVNSNANNVLALTGSALIPEPATMSLLVLGVVGMVVRRRR